MKEENQFVKSYSMKTQYETVSQLILSNIVPDFFYEIMMKVSV